jgi:hypothetical protein
MKLRSARLCLDCDEVHDAYRCPACTSESFAYITRWVPAPERNARSGPTTSPEAEVYKALVNGDGATSGGRRALKSGLVGIAAVGLLGWLLGRDKS